MKRSAILAATLLWAASTALAPVAAQDFPTKPIRVILPSAPGGAGDAVVRAVGRKIEERWGQQLIIDHKPGAGGVIGMQAAKGAAADGYNLVLGYIGVVSVNPFIYSPAPYDTLRDFVPIGMLSTFPNVLEVRIDLPVKSVAELIAYAKANPGKLNYASAGNATSPHLTTELFKRRVGVDITHIPFKGAGPAMVEFLAGRIDVMFDNLVTSKQHMNSGKFRVLGITTARRSGLAPDIPTIAELGVEGFESVGWFGLLAPAGVPQPVADKLSREIAAIMKTPDTQKQFRDIGFEPESMTQAEFRAFVQRDIEKWGRLVREAGIKAE